MIVHNEQCACGKNTLWLEIEGRTDDTLVFAGGVKIAPMSLYKILEEVKAIRRFQLIQTGQGQLELRLISGQREEAFAQARKELLDFLKTKGVENVQIVLSQEPPQADPASGKFKHIYRQKGIRE